ncbi:MAG: hypothetical protein K0S39_3279 [Paenibacillus sp.]|jgi:glutaredoxin|nr:hypothetical protein [Paenibacillus sp.]
MANNIEVFTAGSYLCDGVVNQVKELACPNCEVLVYDLNQKNSTEECVDKAKAYGVRTVPAVAINGKLVDFDVLKKARLSSISSE